MIQTIRVATKGITDKARVYRLEGITKKQATILAEKLFCESINQQYSLNAPLFDGSRAIEIAYKPGVMNPEVASLIKAALDLGITLLAADSSSEYYLSKKIMRERKLFNPTIEYIVDQAPKTLLVSGAVGVTTSIPLRTMAEAALLDLSQDKLFLNLEEMQVIQRYFQKIKRDPTDCELETLAQTWSEHCGHKTFKAQLIVDGKKKTPLFTRLQKEALKHKKHIVSAFVDNSGVMDFYDGMAICGKVETHNSPSAIEPYGGAMTGSGGVFRDILGTGLGAKTIASTDMFCFADPSLPKKDLPAGCLPPDYLLKRVVTGVKDYGNRMGIPTNNGSVHFHNDFRAKPSVIVGAYGLIPKKQAQKGQVRVGDLVIAVGGRTGRDGIHGATFSSAVMTDRTISVNSSAVQIGNAIEEKRTQDAILEARNRGLIRALQDCGAGGFSSAIGEMGEATGVKVDLSKAPLKYQGLSPWEIWVSESQERMILGVAKEKAKQVIAVCKKYNVEAVVLGEFDGSKKLQVSFGRKIVCSLDMEFLHHGLPQRTMVARSAQSVRGPAARSSQVLVLGKQSFNELRAREPFARVTPSLPSTQQAWISVLKKVLSHGNVCSKEPIVRLYDHTVQGTNSLQPFVGEQLDGPSDAAVIRPILGKPYGFVLSHGLNPILNTIDPYWGSIWAGVEALSNYVAVGGDYREASLINNYVWPFPDEASLWSLDRSVDAVVDTMKTFKIPVISGKDSLSSTYRGKDGLVIKIPPVLCMSVFGRIPDVAKTISSDFKQAGSSVYLVGKLDINALGGCAYYDAAGVVGATVPKPDLGTLPNVFRAVFTGIQKGKILSCHDVSEGGLLTSLFEMSVGGDMGVHVSLPKKEQADNFLFNETAGCFLVEVANDVIAHKVFANVPFMKLGTTQKAQTIVVEQNKQILFEAGLTTLKKAWQKPMQKIFS